MPSGRRRSCPHKGMRAPALSRGITRSMQRPSTFSRKCPRRRDRRPAIAWRSLAWRDPAPLPGKTVPAHACICFRRCLPRSPVRSRRHLPASRPDRHHRAARPTRRCRWKPDGRAAAIGAGLCGKAMGLVVKAIGDAAARRTGGKRQPRTRDHRRVAIMRGESGEKRHCMREHAFRQPGQEEHPGRHRATDGGLRTVPGEGCRCAHPSSTPDP